MESGSHDEGVNTIVVCSMAPPWPLDGYHHLRVSFTWCSSVPVSTMRLSLLSFPVFVFLSLSPSHLTPSYPHKL